jgi:hypothetical protein
MLRSRFTTGLLLFTAAALAPGQTQQYLISTVAGREAALDPPAPAAQLSIGWANGVTTGAAGNVYFSSPDLQAVFKVDTTGMATHVAGNFVAGYSGDGGPATSAQLNLG